ncbi:hypothetical protein C8R43DRAFT_944433 [Mycena crocata]|nr:hypothetical protein C8R43DRAFT_944433 [Mycena crocata]
MSTRVEAIVREAHTCTYPTLSMTPKEILLGPIYYFGSGMEALKSGWIERKAKIPAAHGKRNRVMFSSAQGSTFVPMGSGRNAKRVLCSEEMLVPSHFPFGTGWIFYRGNPSEWGIWLIRNQRSHGTAWSKPTRSMGACHHWRSKQALDNIFMCPQEMRIDYPLVLLCPNSGTDSRLLVWLSLPPLNCRYPPVIIQFASGVSLSYHKSPVAVLVSTRCFAPPLLSHYRFWLVIHSPPPFSLNTLALHTPFNGIGLLSGSRIPAKHKELEFDRRVVNSRAVSRRRSSQRKAELSFGTVLEKAPPTAPLWLAVGHCLGNKLYTHKWTGPGHPFTGPLPVKRPIDPSATATGESPTTNMSKVLQWPGLKHFNNVTAKTSMMSRAGSISRKSV